MWNKHNCQVHGLIFRHQSPLLAGLGGKFTTQGPRDISALGKQVASRKKVRGHVVRGDKVN